MQFGRNYRAILLAGAASIALSPTAFATDYVYPGGTAPFTLQTGDTLTLDASGNLNALTTWALNHSGTAPVIVNNSGVINNTGGRAFDTSGSASGAQSFTLNNLTSGSSITSTTSDAFRINNSIGAGTVTINNAGLIQTLVAQQTFDFGSVTSAATFNIMNSAGASMLSAGDDVFQIGNGAVYMINNAGTIQSNGTGNRAFNIQNDTLLSSFSLINSGLIQSAKDAIRITGTVGASQVYTVMVDNSGTMSSIGTGSNHGGFDFSALTSASGVISITNRATGIIQSADSDGLRPGTNATVTNYGKIIGNNGTVGVTGNASGNDGVDFQSSAGGVVKNMAGGTITGARDGITGKYAPNITNAGTITGLDGSGINIDTALDASPVGPSLAATGTTVVVNTGTIVGTAVSGDGDAIDVDYLTNITNSGTIKAVGIDPVSSGSLNEALAIGGGTVTNNVGGLIISDERAITVDDSNLGNAYGLTTIDNAGTITGKDGQAINITSTFADVLTNRATGVINGSVVLGAGNNIVNLYAGQVLNGTLDGGAGTDTINLLGTGSGTLTGVSNVEILNVGSGTWTLSGNQTYTAAVTVTGGSLRASGSLATSTLAVANGATLSVASGTAPATLALQGNLSLAHGATLAAYVTPTAASRINVLGTAALDGAFVVNPAAGNYSVGTRYTVINSVSGVSGQFASASTATPSYFKARLGYDANNVYLYLDQVSLKANTSGATANQQSVSGGIDAAIAGGASPGSAFQALFGLSGAALNAALDQVSGAVGPNISQSVSYGAFTPFVNLMLSGGQAAPDAMTAQAAPGTLYGAVDGPRPAQLVPDKLRVWGSVYGGHAGLSADGATGAASLSASSVGGAGGVESQFKDGTRAGISLGGGHQDFASGNGTGSSTDMMLGVYGRTPVLGQGYVAAALAYGWHNITTSRTVTVSGVDTLAAKFDAHEIGGRVEAGYRLDLDMPFAVTPFAAFAGDAFAAPGYVESAAAGASTFALAYAPHVTDTSHTELGARLSQDIAMQDGSLSLGAMAAWAHSLDDNPIAVAAFQGLAGSSFQVSGTHVAADTAILGLDLGVQSGSGLSYGVAVNGQVGNGTTILSGSGTLAWRW